MIILNELGNIAREFKEDVSSFDDLDSFWGSKLLNSETWRDVYHRGYRAPNFPAPAPILKVWVCPDDVESEFHNSIGIDRVVNYCECCGNPQLAMECVWDFDFDRAMDFHLKCGVYAHWHDIVLGHEMWEAERQGMVPS